MNTILNITLGEINSLHNTRGVPNKPISLMIIVGTVTIKLYCNSNSPMVRYFV